MKSDQLSQTAAFIAVKLYGLTREEKYRAFFDEDTLAFYDQLVKFLPAPINYYYSALQKKWVRSFFIQTEEWLLPGDLMHILMRKYYIQQAVQKLYNHSYEQLLVLGGGFDHISSRYSHKGMKCLEVDLPKMITLKQDFLDAFGYSNSNLYLKTVTPDGASFKKQLRSSPKLSTQQKTIVLAEGFFDYITEAQVEHIFDDLTHFFKNDIALVSTVFDLSKLSPFRRLVFKSSVAMVGEKLKFNHSISQFLQLVARWGFTNETIISYKQMEQDLLVPAGISLPVLSGFYLLETFLQKDHKKGYYSEHFPPD